MAESVRREARRRFAEWGQGDPRGVLRDMPLHLRTTPVTAEFKERRLSAREQYETKRRAVLKAQAEVEAALLEHQREIEVKEAEGKQKVAVEGEKGRQARETDIAQGDIVERGGYRYQRPAGESDYRLLGPSRFRPPSTTLFGSLTPEQRLTRIDWQNAGRASRESFDEGLAAKLGTVTEKKAVYLRDKDGNIVLDAQGNPQTTAIETRTSKGVELSPIARTLQAKAGALVDAVGRGPYGMTADEAIAEFDKEVAKQAKKVVRGITPRASRESIMLVVNNAYAHLRGLQGKSEDGQERTEDGGEREGLRTEDGGKKRGQGNDRGETVSDESARVQLRAAGYTDEQIDKILSR